MQTVIDPVKATELYKKEWLACPELQTEFADNYDVYAAYRLAEDRGLVKPQYLGQRRVDPLQLAERISLEWQLTHSLRERFGNFDAYRRHRWQELNCR